MTKEEMGAAIERLRAVDFAGTDSYGRLARICNALCQPEHGWTKGACEGLRQFIINLLEQAVEADSAYGDGIRDGMEQALTGLADDELAEHGLMRLPKDANGEYIHIGDVMVYADGDTCPRPAVALVSQSVFLTDEGPRYADMCRHYHKPTVEDVLNELCTKAFHSREFGAHVSYRDVIAEYADKLQLKEGQHD